jgi:hypothetical protein
MLCPERLTGKKLKFCFKLIVFCLVLLPAKQFAQHHSVMDITVDAEKKILHVKQQLTFVNQSPDTLHSIVLNDWNNSYSAKDTPLAKRFSDEFVRSFHLAKESERGNTTIISINNLYEDKALSWERPKGHPDLAEVTVNAFPPGGEITLDVTYDLKIPNARFTGFGYDAEGNMYLKDCFLSAARYENHDFIRNSNNNLDDIANGFSDIDVTLHVPKNTKVISDLEIINPADQSGYEIYLLKGKSLTGFNLFLESEKHFYTFKNDIVNVQNSIDAKRTGDITKAIVVDQVVHFVHDELGNYPYPKITVAQEDYERNPFYGLNQLPSFLNVFPDDFLYELKFLKTYTNNYLKNSLKLDPRKDNWIYDALQVYLMMKYIDAYHPQIKMTGGLAAFKLLKSYNLVNLQFNGQYSYFYMLMARKNIDQPVGALKNTLIKFNEQIAGKYRAGLSLKYLDSYLGNHIVDNTIKQFLLLNRDKQATAEDFESMLKANAGKDIDWFFKTVINSRDIIDYKFDKVTKSNDSISFTIKNKTGVIVPMPVYGVRDGNVVFKQWIDGTQADSTYTVKRNDAEKIVLNYRNEVPEFNLRNNWRSLKDFKINNRPIKFVFFKDLEDPYYNQILFVPTLTYNLYDGLMPGIRLYNKTVLDKAFIYDVNPTYSPNTQSLSGSSALVFNQYNRDSRLYHVKYYVTASDFHYAPDARYIKINPSVQFAYRPEDFRDNRKQYLRLREILVNRQKTNYNIDDVTENYSVFDARYSNTKTEVTNHFNIITDFQAAAKFGKVSAELEYRKLFESNRQLDLRFYAGSFLYNRTEGDYFSFALDRPTDYLFDYNYYGRSEKSGLFSQQLILAEGGFKSKLDTPFANQWMTTLNAGINIWNWVEVYGDAGLMKNRSANPRFLFDSGVRLNLVTDYFELYFPVYSSNGWEFQQDYSERIRFIVTLDPKILINLFTRKWF